MKNKENTKKTLIGGQALMEGVMMRGKTSMAMAVRDEDGIIRRESTRIKPSEKSSKFFRLPIVRGCKAFVNSFIGGMQTLMRSAEVYGETEEPSRFEKWLSKTFKIDLLNVVLGVALILALGLAVVLFVLVPQLVRNLLEWAFSTEFSPLAKNFIEGGVKILIFISYILLCALVPDVKRTFMYHGAEHKTISCYEEGLELTPENAKKCSRIHDRCGTTFMVFVMVISILVFAVFESVLGVFNAQIDGILRVLLKIAVLPLIAGISYELLRGLAKTKSKLVLPLKWPGMLLQRITTKEPDEDMLEVAITAFNMVVALDADENLPTETFVMPKPAKEVTETVIDELKSAGIEDVADAEWIVALSANIKRDEVYSDKVIKAKYIDTITKLTEDRKSGRPLWYCVGDTEFFDYKIKVDERVLIPRPETELLVENAIKVINSDTKVLDLCTGSGAIAIAISKKTGANVTASDISAGAIELATQNAKDNGAQITFVQSDMFASFSEEKFDVIISNPPYIKSEDIATLQDEVKNFEPLLALDGGFDGLDFYKTIAQNLTDRLNVGGYLFIEFGIGQAEALKSLFEVYGEVEIIKDYSDIERIIKLKVN